MKIPQTVKPELLVSKDRPCISALYLKDNYLIATDGKRLQKVLIEREDGDTDGYITVEAIKAARKEAKKLPFASLKANGALILPSGVSFPRPTEETLGMFPNVEQAIPSSDRKEARIGINADMLAEVAQAIGAYRGDVTVRIALKSDGSIDGNAVLIIDNCNGAALLMPCRI